MRGGFSVSSGGFCGNSNAEFVVTLMGDYQWHNCHRGGVETPVKVAFIGSYDSAQISLPRTLFCYTCGAVRLPGNLRRVGVAARADRNQRESAASDSRARQPASGRGSFIDRNAATGTGTGLD